MKTCPSCDKSWSDDLRFCPDDGAALRLSPGTVLNGRFEILWEIGQGAMGIVYLATQLGPLERRCAIKVLNIKPHSQPGAVSDAISRLRQEARILGALDAHPNLVTVYDAVQDDSGLAYIAMEYVEGETLRAKIDRSVVFSALQVARIIRQVANGLASAHERDVVHRDLKPGNIILTQFEGRDDWVKIVDFGIAKALGDTAADKRLTMAGFPIGTIPYMSPEQLGARELDHRSDQYTLGLIAVELLADELPVPTATESGRDALDDMPATEEWPEHLKDVLSKCLSLDAEARYDSVAAFAKEFDDSIHSWMAEPVDNSGPGLLSSGRVKRKGRGPLIIAATAIVAVIGAWRLLPRLDAGRPVLVAGVDSTQIRESETAGAERDTAINGADTGSVDAARTESDTATRGRTPDQEESEPGGDSTSAVPPSPLPTEVEETETPSVPAGGQTPDSGEAVLSTLASVEELRALVDLDTPDIASLRRTVAGADRLLGISSVPDTTRAELAYLMAEARLMLGEDEAGCRDLRRITDLAANDSVVARRFERAVQALLELNCPR